MIWPKLLRRKSFSHARRIGWVSKLAAHPFFARSKTFRLPLNPGAAGDNKPGVLPVMAENTGALFSILLSLILIIALVSLLTAFALELRRDTFSFEGFSVPKDLLERGYSPAAVSDEVIGEIHKIQQAAVTRHNKRSLESLQSLPDLQLSSSGLSMNSVVRYARRLLSLPENRISGRILKDGAELRLMLVVNQGNRGESIEVRRDDGDIQALLKDAGRAIVQSVDGYVLAAYLMDQEKASGKFPATLAAIDYVLTHPPATDHPWATNLLGRVRHLEGKDDLALEAFRTLISLYPQFSNGPSALVEQLVYSDRIKEARQYTNALRQVAKSPGQWEQVFWAAHSLGDWPEAVDAARHEISLGGASGYEDLFHGLGHAGRYQESLTILEKVSAQDPKKFRAFVSAELLARAGRKQEAINMARAAVSAAAGSGQPSKLRDAYRDLGTVLAVSGEPVAALVEFQRAIDRGLAVNDQDFSYGDALLAVGRSQEALEFFRMKMREQPRVWDGYVGAARANVALGHLAEANQLFEIVARESPLDPTMFNDWAASLEAAGKTDEARAVRMRGVTAAENLRHELTLP